MSEDVLFNSAADALRFAFNFSHQQYDRPLMNRMIDIGSGSGKGLSGMDGAAQAGMIRRELNELSNLYRAVLIARFAPRTFPCTCGSSCCAGTSTNFEWREAVNTVASYSCDCVPGGAGKYRLRRALVFRLYGSGHTLSSIADDVGVSEQTASAHNSRIVLWLRGSPPKKNRSFVMGVEEAAENAVQGILSRARMISP